MLHQSGFFGTTTAKAQPLKKLKPKLKPFPEPVSEMPPLSEEKLAAIQQAKRERMQQLAEERRKKIPKFKHKAQLAESLSQKIMKALIPEAEQKAAGLATAPAFRLPAKVEAKGEFTYSQDIILNKINPYLVSRNRAELDKDGCCHGLSLTWLLLMSWRLENLFYYMIKVIVEVPADQLANYEALLKIFDEAVDLGQNPENYGEGLAQKHLDKILGGTGKATYLKKNYSKEQLDLALKGVFESNNMVCLGGGYQKVGGKDVGHCVAIFYRDGLFYCFDANYRKFEAKVFTNLKALRQEAWERLFDILNCAVPSGESAKLRICAVNSEVELPLALKPLLGFFAPSLPSRSAALLMPALQALPASSQSQAENKDQQTVVRSLSLGSNQSGSS